VTIQFFQKCFSIMIENNAAPRYEEVVMHEDKHEDSNVSNDVENIPEDTNETFVPACQRCPILYQSTQKLITEVAEKNRKIDLLIVDLAQSKLCIEQQAIEMENVRLNCKNISEQYNGIQKSLEKMFTSDQFRRLKDGVTRGRSYDSDTLVKAILVYMWEQWL
jgi:DNA repair exonuclease SbcCD nuclease subunit